MTATIKYVPAEEPIMLETRGPAAGLAMFGFYRITYEDGFGVMLPHQGYVGTVSAWPLDVSDPEQRKILMLSADKIHANNTDVGPATEIYLEDPDA